MADVFTKAKRSQIMSRIRSKETGIEKAVFSFLRKQQIYFQKHYSRAPGKPDIALPSQKKAVFINGDYWHGYKFNFWKKRIPKIYWQDKIAGNITRDKKNYRKLRRRGWKLLIIWGHDVTEKPKQTFEKIAYFLTAK